MQRVALYIRVSTDEQAKKGLSLGDQRKNLTDYAEKHGFHVVGLYEDAGVSARKPYHKRAALCRLLKDCENNLIDTILFVRLDRWFRNVGGYYAVQDVLDAHGVTWQATKEDYETVTASGRLKVNIVLSVAQDEADRDSERIKLTNEGKRQRREVLTGNKPLGFSIENKKFIKDPEKEELVNDFFAKFMETASMSKSRAFIKEKYGYHLNYHAADKLLRSSAYYGRYYDTDGMCPAYITKEQYDHIQTLRRRIVRHSPENRVYYFSGLVVCGECGYRFGARCNVSHNFYKFYSCTGHGEKKNGCGNSVSMSQKKLEAYLVDTFDEHFKQLKLQWENIQVSGPKTNHQKDIKALRNKIKKLQELFINDLISIDECKREQQKCTREIQRLEELDEPVKIPDFEAIESVLASDWKSVYAESAEEDKREFWRMLIKRITVYPDRHIEYELNV